MKKWIGLLAAIFFLAGCSPFGSGVPEGFSKSSYENLENAYRAYEKAKIENKSIDAEISTLFEYRKKSDKGELTEQEVLVRESITRLTNVYTNAYNGLNNESYGIVDMNPDTITAEIGGDLTIEEIRGTEEQVLALLELEPLPLDEKDEEMKRKVHQDSISRIMQMTGTGELGNPASYEDSIVVFRKDRDEYYIASSFSYKGETFKYDMIMDSELNMQDVYVAGVYSGLLSKPMNDDDRPKWLGDLQTDEESTVSDETAESENQPYTPDENKNENGESTIMEDIYGSEKDIWIDENGVKIDEADESETTEAFEEDELPEWDKQQYLGGTILSIADTLESIRQVNADAMSMNLNVDYANEILMTLSYQRDDLSHMLIDPTTNQHLSDSEIEIIQMIINGLDFAIEAEQRMISDPSTQNIRLADSSTEEVQGIISSIQFN